MKIVTRLALLGLVSTLAWTAGAQDEGEADRLFQEGVQLMDANHCNDAIPRFLESQRLDPSAATLLNIATCYARLGKTASAWRTYRRAAEAAVLEKDDDLRGMADKAIAILDPLVTRLRLLSAEGPETLIIKVNGETVEAQGLIPLDPGQNYIEVTAPGRTSWTETVDAQQQGATIVISVPELKPLEETKPEPTTVEASPVKDKPEAGTDPGREPTPPPPRELRPVAVGAFGIGTLGIAVGVLEGIRAKSAYDDSNAYCQSGRCNATGDSLRDTAYDRATVATWATGVGLAAIVAGVVLWNTPHPRQGSSHLTVMPWTLNGQKAFGVSMEGRL